MPHFLLRHATPGSDLPGPRPAKSCAMHADCGQPLPGKASRMGTEAGTQQASQSAELPGEAASFWIASMPGEGFPRLDGDISVDVAVVGNGNYVFERTRVLDVEEGEPCIVRTDCGDVRARDVIVASSLPILDRGLFFAKAHPYRSYTLAARIPAEQAPDGMFINAGGSTRSIRTARDGERLLLIVNGNGHKTGEEPHNQHRYLQLQDFIRTRFRLDEIAYRWSTHDYYTLDHVPYIGRLRRRSRHLYVATGFNGWGMTGGTLAAMILGDLVLGNDNPWAQLYDANRLKVRGAASMLVKENAKVARHWVGDRLARTDAPKIDAVAAGEGARPAGGGAAGGACAPRSC